MTNQSKGLHRDYDLLNQPQNTSPYIKNGNLTEEYGSVSNERSVEVLTTHYTGYKIIGDLTLDDNSKVLFFVNKSNNNCFIARQYVNGNLGELTTITTLLNFKNDKQIEATYKKNIKGEWIIYWVDNYNSPKYLNIGTATTPKFTPITNTTQLDSLDIFPKRINDIPLPNQLKVTETGGNLKSGVYYVCYAYGDLNKNFTDYNGFQNPIPIIKATNINNFKQYDGVKADTSTSKAITLSITSTEIDPKFNYVSVGVVSKINGIIKAYKFKDIFYQYSPSFDVLTLTIDSLDNAEEVSINDLIVGTARYNKAKTIKSMDNELFLANLESTKEINLQPYFNRSIVDYTTNTNTDTQKTYRDEYVVTVGKSFMYDEVYALYGTVVWKDGTESKAFHIPGRPLKKSFYNSGTLDENALASSITNSGFRITDSGSPAEQLYSIDNDVKVFNVYDTSNNANPYINAPWAVASNMGYYENNNEYYPDDSQWDIKNTSDAVVGTLRNQNVRHHKFPTALLQHPDDADYNKTNSLGFIVKNLDFPTSIKNNIYKINFYYAKRTLNNRTILGQSLLIHAVGYKTRTTNDTLRKTIFNGFGNMLCGNIVEDISGTGFGTGGLVPNPIFGNSAYSPFDKADSFGANWDYDDKGYFRFHAFDLLQNNVDISGASYIKNVLRYSSRYTAKYIAPDPSWSINNSTVCTAALNFKDLNPFAYGSPDLNNQIRVLNNKGYVPVNTFYDNNNPFGTYMYPQNGGGETTILLETNKRINIGNDDFQYIDFQNNTSITNSFNNTLNTGSQNYITNLCQYKVNMYFDLDNQELCYAGQYKIIELGSGKKIFGGDTFVNWYGFKTTVDLQNLVNGNRNDGYCLKALHYFICQSNSNINYRYQGNLDNEVYYPKNTETEIFNRPSTLQDTEDNWFGYNTDYSSLNDIRQPIINTKIFNEEPYVFKTRVIKSNKDNLESTTDNFRKFLVNNKVDLDTNRGQIEILARSGDLLIIHLTKAITRTMSRQTLQVDETTAYLGNSDIFSIPTKEIIYTDIGYGGTTSQWANVVTPFGYMYPDTQNRKIFSLGDTIKEISSDGMIRFFNENCKMLLYEQLLKVTSTNFKFPLIDNPAITNGTGFIATWDTKYRRYLLTKRDYILTPTALANFKGLYLPGVYPENSLVWDNDTLEWKAKIGGVFTVIPITDTDYFIDKSWTISYYPEFECWGSFYDYIPYGYTEDSTGFFGFDSNKIYKHNSETSFGVFYNSIKYPFIVDIVYNDNAVQPKIWNSFSYLSKFTDLNQNIDYLKTFDKYTTYNSYQISKTNDLVNLSTARYVNGVWNVSQFRNIRNDYSTPVYDKDYNLYNNIDLTKAYNFRDTMNDKFMVARLEFENNNQGILSLQYSDSFNQPKIR